MRVNNIIFWHNIITSEKIFSKEDIDLLREVDPDLHYSPSIYLKESFFKDLKSEITTDLNDEDFELLKEKINLFGEIWEAREEGKNYKPKKNYKDEDVFKKRYECDPVFAEHESQRKRGYENTYWGF